MFLKQLKNWPLSLFLLFVAPLTIHTAEPIKPLPLELAYLKAKSANKYGNLLAQISAPKDIKEYSEYHDFGYRNLATYQGHSDLPSGHWVYVYPHWYIWEEKADKLSNYNRAWGPEQATGAPNTPWAGDIRTAWASRTPDAQNEWLLLEYASPIIASGVHVYETYNPGALTRISVFQLDGKEVPVWEGKDPTQVGSGKGVSKITFSVPFKTNRVKLYITSKKVTGWNEIDAVGLVDSAGQVQWAKHATASTTYAVQKPSK